MTEYIYEEIVDRNGVTCYIKRGELVRCKKCKHRRPVMHTTYGSCIFSACLVKSDGFCSHGEIETEEVQQTLL